MTYNQSSNFNYSQLSASLNYLNNNKCYSPSFKSQDKDKQTWFASGGEGTVEEKPKIHLLSKNNSLNNNTDDNEDKSNDIKSSESGVKIEDKPQQLLPAIIEHITSGGIETSTDTQEQPIETPPIEVETEPKVQQSDTINLINANVEESTGLISGVEKIEDVTPKPDSPLNNKSLLEELESAGAIVSNNDKETQTMSSSPIVIKTFVAPPLKYPATVDLIASKSLDTDSSGGECEEKAPPVIVLPTKTPERSFSSESLNSLTSVDSNDSKSSIRITENKFAKNGTLERQQHAQGAHEKPAVVPTGLKMLVLWNNKLTKASSKPMTDMLCNTITLEMLNIGRNHLGNDFVLGIKTSLRLNTSLQTLGLQGTHLSCPGLCGSFLLLNPLCKKERVI